MLTSKSIVSPVRMRNHFKVICKHVTTVAATEVSQDVSSAKPFSEIPRENKLKFLSRFLPGGQFYQKDFRDMFSGCRDLYGEIFVMPSMMGRDPVVVTYSPADTETVFRNEGIWPNRAGLLTMKYYREEYRKDLYEGIEGLVTTQGEKWGNFRTKVNPVLMQQRNVDLFVEKISELNLEFVERIKELRDKSTLEVPDNFEHYLNYLTLESVAIVGLDRKLGLVSGKSDDIRPQQLCQALLEFFELGFELDFKPSLWRWVATPKFKRLMQAHDTISDVTSSYVDEGLEILRQEKEKGIERPVNEQSILEKMVKIDPKVAKVMVMDMLFAGVDTTSSMLASILLFLAKNPDKQEKLREEIRQVLPHKNVTLTRGSYTNMPYLKAVVKETQRLNPLVPAHNRVLVNDVVLSGYQVPKGTEITMVQGFSNKDPKYFIEPEKFLPERWLRSNRDTELQPQEPFALLPFGFGPRTCIGKRIVDLELSVILSHMLRNFQIEFNYPSDDAFKTYLISVPKIPLKFKFTDIE